MWPPRREPCCHSRYQPRTQAARRALPKQELSRQPPLLNVVGRSPAQAEHSVAISAARAETQRLRGDLKTSQEELQNLGAEVKALRVSGPTASFPVHRRQRQTLDLDSDPLTMMARRCPLQERIEASSAASAAQKARPNPKEHTPARPCRRPRLFVFLHQLRRLTPAARTLSPRSGAHLRARGGALLQG